MLSAPGLPEKVNVMRQNASKATKKAGPGCLRIQAQPGRGDWIRTSGLYVPNVALYQTEPHLEMAAEEGFEPSQTESESAVLPLHNSAISFCVPAEPAGQRYLL